ncbi:beta-ketoacyl synthase N-terminal-like domain-containing protein [Bacillus velezensis]
MEEFWRNLKEGKDSITTIPKERWDWQAFDGDPNLEGNKTNIKWGGFIDGIAEFDPLFFGISPREARYLDPAAAAVIDLCMAGDRRCGL